MAGNSKRTMLLDLKVNLDSKDAERNIASLGKDIMTLMNAMNSSGKGMNVFKELVSYISKLDSEMNAFRSKHANDFDRIFGGIDTTLLNQMQTIFGVTKAQLNEINALRDKVAAARKNPNTSADEIKFMEKEVRDLYAAVGKSGESGISGRGALETRLDRLEGSLNNFAKTWESVNDRVSKGFGSKGGSGTGTGAGAGSDAIANELDEMSREIQEGIAKLDKDIEELKRKKEELNQVISSDRKYSGDIDLNIDSVRKLVDEYNSLSDVMKTADKNSGEYHDSLVKLVGVSAKLNAAFHKIKSSDEDVKAQFRDTILSEKDGLRSTLYGEVATKGGDRKHQDLVMKARDTSERYGGLIGGSQSELDSLKAAEKRIKKNKELGLSYSKVAKYASDYMEINSKYDADGNLSKVDEDNKKQIENQLKQLAKAKGLAQKSIKEVFEAVDMGNIASADDMYQKLCNVLGVDIPKNAQKAEDALKSVDRAASSTDSMTNDGLDKINEQPSKPDSKDVADINKVEGALEDVGSQAKEAFNAIGKGADKAKPSVDRLSQSLQKAFTDATNLQLDVLDGKTQGKETMNLVDSNGIVSSVQGDNYIVDGKVLVGQMISNLKDNIVMSLHDHPNAIDAFTPADVEMFAKQYYGQGIKLNGIIANGIIKTIDFNGMSQDVAMSISQSYFDNLSQAAKEYSELFSFDNGNLIPTPAVEKLAQTDPDKYQEINDSLVDLANASLEDAFTRNGVESTVKEFSKSQIPQLSEYINTIRNSAQSALTPVEKLQNLITSLNPDKTIDWNKYNDDLTKFANNEVDTISTFNKISNDLRSDADVKDVSKARQKNLDAVQKDVAPQIEAEANAHRDNANAIKEEADAKEKLISTKDTTDTQMDESRAEVEKTISSYEELCSVIERYNKLASKSVREGAGLTKQEDRELSDITSRIVQTKTGGDPNRMVDHAVAWNSLVDPITRTVNTDRIAQYLGIEIPQAAEKAKQAIKEVDNTKAEAQKTKTKSKLEEAKKAKSDLSSDKSIIDESEISAANAKLEEFINLTKTIRNSPVLENVDIGNFKGQLAYASKALGELHQKGLITAEDMSRIGKAGSEAIDYLDSLEKDNDKDIIDLKSVARDAKRLQGELESTQQQLSESKSKAEELSNELANVSNKLQELSGKDVIDEQSIKDAQSELKQFISLCNKIADIDVLSDKEIGAYEERLKSSAQHISELKSKGMLTDKEYNKSKEPQLAAFERLQWITDDNKKVATEQEKAYKKQITDLEKQIKTIISSDDSDEMRSNLAAADSQIKALEKKIQQSDFVSTMLDKQVKKLKGQLASKEAELNSLRAVQSSEVTDTSSKDNKTDVKTTSSDGASLKEYQQLEMLDAKLKEVKAAIEAKTQAFREEGSTVDSVVASEAAALEKLSSKLDEIVTKIKLVGDSFKQINSGSVDQVEGAKQEKTPTTTSDVGTTSGKWALDSTLSTTNSILQGILTAVNSSDSESQISDALKGAINELKAAAEAIKINANDIKDKSEDSARDTQKDSVRDTQKDTSNNKKEKTFDEIKSNEISSFEKYKKDVESSIHVTDKFKSKLGELYTDLSNVKDADGLKAWKESFNGFQNEFDRFKAANQKVLTGQINAIKNEAKAAMKGLDLDIISNDPEKRAKQEEIAQGFKEIQIASDICASKVKSNQNVEIGALNATKMQLLENINAYRQQYGLLNGGKSGKNYGNSAAIRETTRYNKFQQYANDADMGFKDSATFNAQLQKYISAYKQLMDLRSKFASKPVLTDRDVQEFNDAKQACADYGKELDKMIAKSNKLDANKYQSSAIGSDVNIEDASSRKQALTDFVTGMHDARESTIQFSKDYQECTFKMKNEDGTWTRMTATLDKVSNKMYSTAGEVTKYGTAFGEFIGALKGQFLKLGRYMIASFGFEEVIQVVRQGITYVKEIDDALTDLKKVTNETDAGYERFLQTMSKTAGVVGSTVAELTTMAAEWARLGWILNQPHYIVIYK